jgi:septum formation protein
MHPIILASQSPRRKQLLEWAEVAFEIKVQETEETYPPQMPVTEVPVFIARNKALAVQHHYNFHHRVILAADTIVVLDKEVIGKPRDRNDAINIITKLSGNTHQVITGVVILQADKETAFYDVTEVAFHTLTPEQISWYVDKYAPYDKAGAYAIQEWIGVVGIKGINGDFYNVMGLPVSRVVQALRSF